MYILVHTTVGTTYLHTYERTKKELHKSRFSPFRHYSHSLRNVSKNPISNLLMSYFHFQIFKLHLKLCRPKFLMLKFKGTLFFKENLKKPKAQRNPEIFSFLSSRKKGSWMKITSGTVLCFSSMPLISLFQLIPAANSRL